MPKHWSEVMACRCGMRFRTSIEEARHRHNFPILCRKRKSRAKRAKVPTPLESLAAKSKGARR